MSRNRNLNLRILRDLSGGDIADEEIEDYDNSSEEYFEEHVYLYEHEYDFSFHLLSTKKANISKVEGSDFEMNVMLDSDSFFLKKPSLPYKLFKRQIGLGSSQKFSLQNCCSLNNCYLPNRMIKKIKYKDKPFCGTYSQDGDVFLSASQDKCIRIYSTRGSQFNKIKTIKATDVGWSILDTAFSPDGMNMVYSSWSDYLNLFKLNSDVDEFIPLNLEPTNMGSFGIFSVVFSQDGNELLGGSNDDSIYVYNFDLGKRTLKILAHMTDVNAVMFADESSQILFSGSDDGLCKVWDRRTMDENRPDPVGVFSGHIDGIVYIDSKRDGRYLISNSKDQTIKLWDMRKFSNKDDIKAARNEMDKYNWDYRWQIVPNKLSNATHLWDTTSLMTYSGHNVQATLIRSRFSPAFSTGQRFIYTGCASGHLIVYDVLTGDIVRKLFVGNNCCVRDVSWHPFENNIVTTSWDCSIGKWSYYQESFTDDTN